MEEEIKLQLKLEEVKMELVKLRRENKALSNRNRHLEELHFQDQADLARMRRWIDFLMEYKEESK